MLVLSRSEGEGITFPDMDLKVKVLRITGNRVQVGIDADPKIRALRSELASSDLGQKPSQKYSHYTREPEVCCDLQNQINALQQTLDIAQQQLDRGESNRAEWTLEQLHMPRSVSKVSEAGANYCVKPQVEPASPEQQLAC